ncbi:MAG: hypothetical protein ACLUEN_00110 [Coprococcus sp.]
MTGDGKYHYVVNKKMETMLAREEQNQIKEKFKEWTSSRNRKEERNIVDYYNQTFTNTRLREYDGSSLAFPGMNPEIEIKNLSEKMWQFARILLEEIHCSPIVLEQENHI